MPITGRTGIPDPGAPNRWGVAGTLVEWATAEGTIVTSGQRIGTVEVAGRRYGLIICFPAAIQKLDVRAGSTVDASDSILKWFADGEDIPHGRPLFSLSPDTK